MVIFDPAFLTVATLTFSLVELSPPRIQCVRGGGKWGPGAQTDKHLSQSPFTGKFV
jgi:hypothetical protein